MGHGGQRRRTEQRYAPYGRETPAMVQCSGAVCGGGTGSAFGPPPGPRGSSLDGFWTMFWVAGGYGRYIYRVHTRPYYTQPCPAVFLPQSLNSQ